MDTLETCDARGERRENFEESTASSEERTRTVATERNLNRLTMIHVYCNNALSSNISSGDKSTRCEPLH